MNPYNPEEYLLGVMLDGESYRQSSNTKDREMAHRIYLAQHAAHAERLTELELAQTTP